MVEIDGLREFYNQIYDFRTEIAQLKTEKAQLKPQLWEEATGTVDQKKDFIRSRTADLDYRISECEAGIELAYNLVNLLIMEHNDE